MEMSCTPVRKPRLATRPVAVTAVPLLLAAGVIAGIAPATAAAALARTGSATSFSISGRLTSVAATSASNAWAAGSTSGVAIRR